MIRGMAYIDLTDGDWDRMLKRVGILSTVPDGATAVVNVGALAVDPAAARIVAEQQQRIDVILLAEPWNVGRWLDRIHNPDILTTGVAS